MRVPAPLRQLLAWVVGGFVAGLGVSYYHHGFIGPTLITSPAAIAPEAASSQHTFESDAAIMLKFVRADKVTDFEATVAKLREALESSHRPERQQQRESWKVFRAMAPATNGDAIYVFEFDPVVRGADYTVSRILTEAFPQEATALYARYAGATDNGQHVIDLTLVAALSSDQPNR